MNIRHFYKTATALLAASLLLQPLSAQESPKEEDFFRILKVTAPEGTLLEVGGLTMMPDGNLALSTRRGDIYIVENPTSKKPYFRKFASGLHEVLGIAYKDGSLYCAQRGELTKLTDTNQDGRADLFETVYAWPVSGHYHEYSFGPKLAPDGSFFVSGNVAFGDEQWYRGESRVPWRGWMMHILPDGTMEPYATGFRSPCGISMVDGQLMMTDNQGDWIGSGGILVVEKGKFYGHPAGLRWTGMPNSPLHLTKDELYAVVDGREIKDANGHYIKPENREKETFVTLFEAKEKIPQIQLPSVWLPHGVLGISNSEIVKIADDNFGPFGGQLLVGDQGQSKISRVFLEKVNGEYQGAAWEFRSGFQSGVLRMAWAPDGSLFVGETNRGWGSAGEANDGLQRLVWNNRLPFEMRTVKAMPDGFEIAFTKEVNRKQAEDLASYTVQSFIYKYQPVYGSPQVNVQKLKVVGVKVAADGMSARIVVNGLRKNYIHQITLNGVAEKESGYTIVHPVVYYTLNSIPEGKKLALSELSTKNSGGTTAKTAGAATNNAGNAVTKSAVSSGAPAAINGLLVKYTCTSCHNPDKKQVGPGFRDVAKRNYSAEKIVSLIYNPQKKNWPDYATEMPPMANVPKADALKIAQWIRSLK